MKKNSVRSAGVFLLAAAILTLAGCSASAAEAGMAAGAKRETESLSMDDSVMDSGKEKKMTAAWASERAGSCGAGAVSSSRRFRHAP